VVRFATAVVKVFGLKYLREPNTKEIARLMSLGESRGFLGMVKSLDFMHWKWKNCPYAQQGQYQDHHKKPTTILETVASQDFWI
jgi:hypothetical protein